MPAITFTAISFFIIQSFRVQAMRNENNSWDRYEATADNFKGADKFLDKNNVPAKARILVIDAYTPNIPFILMNRKGYSVITTSREEILKALNYKFDYVVINNRFLLSDVLNNYPGLKNYLDPVDDNGKITLYNYSKTEKKKSLMEFLGLDKRTPQTDATINFGDSIHSVYWENTDKRIDKMICDFDYGQTGKWSAYIDSANEYGATFHIAASQLNTKTSHLVLFEGEFCSGDSLRDMLIAGYAGHDNTVSYQQYYDLSTQVKERNKWTRVEFLFSIDKIESTDEIKVFIWNPKKKFSCYNNLRVRVY